MNYKYVWDFHKLKEREPSDVEKDIKDNLEKFCIYVSSIEIVYNLFIDTMCEMQNTIERLEEKVEGLNGQ